VELSEANIDDCAHPESIVDAIGYVFDNGIDKASCYKSRPDHVCNYSKACNGATLGGFTVPHTRNETLLASWVVQYGPIAATIDASQQSFQFYSSGVYDEPNCSQTNLDHAITIVGYGNENGNDYWLLKNSWGMTWGDKGYIKMSRNKNNQCGIATNTAYPIIVS